MNSITDQRDSMAERVRFWLLGQRVGDILGAEALVSFPLNPKKAIRAEIATIGSGYFRLYTQRGTPLVRSFCDIISIGNVVFAKRTDIEEESLSDRHVRDFFIPGPALVKNRRRGEEEGFEDNETPEF